MATENENPAGDKPEGESATTPEKPSFMTAADFNKASTAREKKLLDRIDKLLEERLSAKQKAAEEVDENDADDEPEDKGDDKVAAKSPSDATAKQIASLQRQLTRERNEREKREAADREKDAKIARDEERAKLSEALTTAGVDPKRIRGAIALLHTEDKRVRRSAEGKIVFVDENDDEFDLAAGIKQWIASDEGKGYMPARGAQGSGAEPGRNHNRIGTKNQKITKHEAGVALMSLLK